MTFTAFALPSRVVTVSPPVVPLIVGIGSATNIGINIHVFKYREKFQTALEIKREFLPGNGQYRSILRALPNASLFYFSQVRVSLDEGKGWDVKFGDAKWSEVMSSVVMLSEVKWSVVMRSEM